MYEKRGAPPVPHRVFLRRLAAHFGVAITLAPVVHRFLHRFHWEEDDAPRG